MVGNAPEEEPQLDVSVAEGPPSTSSISPALPLGVLLVGKIINGLLLIGVHEAVEKKNRRGMKNGRTAQPIFLFNVFFFFLIFSAVPLPVQARCKSCAVEWFDVVSGKCVSGNVCFTK